MNHRIRSRLIAHGHALAPSAEELRAAAGEFAPDDPHALGPRTAKGSCAAESSAAAGELCAAGETRADGKAFFEWFEQDVLGLDSEEYRRAFWREAYRTGRSIGRVPRTFESWQRERGVHPAARVGDMLFVCLVVGGASLAFWLVCRAVRRHLRRVRRPSYYEAERSRRLALAEARRRQGRRATTNPCPSPEAIRALFAQVRRNPEAALRLGGLLEDLECYLDNRPRFKGERCLGRAGGIKRYLQEYAPDLFEHYSALMRYKAIAKRFRQAAGVADPVSADALLPGAAEGRADPAARERAAEILAEGAGTVVALEAALALRLDPDCIPALADPAAERTGRTPRRLLDWLRRRRSA